MPNSISPVVLGLVTLVTAMFPVLTVADGATIKIGATLALSGKLAFSGLASQRGLIMGVESVNGSGGIAGHRVELVVEDNRGEAAQALSSVRKMIDRDGVRVIYSSFSHITHSIKDTLRRSEVVMIYLGGLGDIAESYELFFQDWSDLKGQGEMLAAAIKQEGKAKVAYLGEVSEGCQALERSLFAELSRMGVEVVGQDTFVPGEADFRSTLLRLRNREPQGLALCGWRDSGLVMMQLSQLGMLHLQTFHIFAPFLPANDTAEYRKLYELNNARSVWLGAIGESMGARQRHFSEKFFARFGEEPRLESFMPYDDILAVAEAGSSCVINERLDSKCLARQLREINLQGVAGELSFDSTRRSRRRDTLIKVSEGRWVDVPVVNSAPVK